MKNSCLACGTPKSSNIYGDMDCPKCNSERFFGFTNKAKSIFVGVANSFTEVNQVDSPVFVGEDHEVLEFKSED
ncbi:MAG: hypothetical protein UR85_C0004G0060 [Candidatus Nomurabacteria bacterium GW2011_GWF2_35_66]|uniref:Uncharacterized protein n=1 Tax=Candidatus Nomurabacteria bacterium GW2011_GWE1_35_16 TaxID=1618761 RepID=A0A0G0DV02_9BACT|nr:MAG: hypothetical protein UR55_C0002G0059 [Candidatus Nomurabacteria bacterium GW2011_GWF1_34_20]KKP63638.1 MAG: hypothetical protein UR57_C0002G0059 [Candidatus Nomurabacteria bacterium GW2011_GWE2_34_25]KKP66840.1 MAG: hypothetical protein UR64_C0002G0056 [Candidatus Nomurabacteria bacterium GW2011_GWE1_35_16]KKP83466.1 MAG: hypothetical protein UR85_C0004G0060 [Candidatus Nomurabacteria bacterium GW2011_GWF2_35_66]HAE36602.1 hypothetical protein [Candidatus Nomurabacteria bacterium]